MELIIMKITRLSSAKLLKKTKIFHPKKQLADYKKQLINTQKQINSLDSAYYKLEKPTLGVAALGVATSLIDTVTCGQKLLPATMTFLAAGLLGMSARIALITKSAKLQKLQNIQNLRLIQAKRELKLKKRNNAILRPMVQSKKLSNGLNKLQKM